MMNDPAVVASQLSRALLDQVRTDADALALARLLHGGHDLADAIMARVLSASHGQSQ